MSPEPASGAVSPPALEVTSLHVYYGQAHALQGVALTLGDGVLAVVGRNGMGKTTLCNAIMGLVRARSGRVLVNGRDVTGMPPYRIAGAGVGYVPQGRRIWPSLSVDEHLRLAAGSGGGGQWNLERIYETFPALAERRRNGGSQLSGGEQQMLAISRALLGNPRLLVMDEPTEGLAPVIVGQVSAMLRGLAEEGEIAVLLIEQNLGVATGVASRVAIMVNGRLVREMPAAELAGDSDLQQRLLGVRAEEHDELEAAEVPAPAAEEGQVFRVRRAHAEAEPAATGDRGAGGVSAARAPTMWSRGNPLAGGGRPDTDEQPRAEDDRPAVPRMSIAESLDHAAYVVGTFDTKGRELGFVARCLEEQGLRVVTVDLSTSQRPSTADVSPTEVAGHHPRGAHAVFTSDRGSAVSAMAEAFERFIVTRRDIGGIISAGGSGGTALATPAMRRLPVGIPKFMVSTVASGDVKRYVGPSDICMMYSVTDVQGINRISGEVLRNAANALAGMIARRGSRRRGRDESVRPALGLTMFGVTTPCVQAVVRQLEDRFDCLVFHATGTGGQSMENLVDSHLLAGVLDITTTEVCDLLMGGVMSPGPDRLGAIIRTRIPWVGSCGALDMVNFGPMDTVPERYRERNLYVHNPQVTLMRTTAEENAEMGRWIGERINRMEGPVRFLIPEGGVSLLDAPGQPFHDPEADAALFSALERTVRQTRRRRLIRLPHNINDAPFVQALVDSFLEIAGAAENKESEHAGA